MDNINQKTMNEKHHHDHEHHHGHEHQKHHHEHEHHHEDSCCCGHEHHDHEHHQEPEVSHPDAFLTDGVKFTCLVENLGCANCAAKMESRINELPEVNAATLTFATKQLRVSVTPEAAAHESALIAKFQEICSSIESEVTVTKQERHQRGKKTLQSQEMKGAKRKFS